MVVWASRTLKRTVKWIPDRQEAFQSDVQGRDHVSIAEMALDKDCRFIGCRITTYAALGAYLNHFSVFIPTAGRQLDAERPLPDAGDLREREGRDDQHRADRRLSRRRSARGGLPDRALRRPHRARDRPDARRDPRQQLHQARPDPVQDRAGRHLRLRRLRDGDAQGHGEGRLEGLRRPPRAVRRQGQVARHRHGDLCREMLGRQSRDGQGAVQRRLDHHHLHRQPDQRPGPRDGAAARSPRRGSASTSSASGSCRATATWCPRASPAAAAPSPSTARRRVGVADKIIAKGKPLAANLLEASAADIDYKDGIVPHRRHRPQRQPVRRRQGRNKPAKPASTTSSRARRRPTPSPTAATSASSRSIPTPARSRS